MDVQASFSDAQEYAFAEHEQDQLDVLVGLIRDYIDDTVDIDDATVGEQILAIGLLAYAAGRKYQDNSDQGKVTLTISAFSASRLLEALLKEDSDDVG